MVEAGDKSTAIVMKPFKASSRVFLNKTAQEMLAIEQGQKTREDMKGGHADAATFAEYGDLGKFDLLMDGTCSLQHSYKTCPEIKFWCF